MVILFQAQIRLLCLGKKTDRHDFYRIRLVVGGYHGLADRGMHGCLADNRSQRIELVVSFNLDSGRRPFISAIRAGQGAKAPANWASLLERFRPPGVFN